MSSLMMKSETPIPAWWGSTVGRLHQEVAAVKAGQARVIAHSPGTRPIHVVSYGEPEPEWRGRANLSSAIGALKPEAYCDKPKRQRPVLFILAGIHGQEMEGMVAAASVIRLMETGCDLRGLPQPALVEKLSRLRLIIVPLANPDGRARVPYEGWVGLPAEEMTIWGQGTHADGEPFGWRPGKAIHPMRGAEIGRLGGYFDDNGVNMMHDNWAEPWSGTTRALLRLTEEEGPDLLLNLHSYGQPPGIFHTDYANAAHHAVVETLANSYYERLVGSGYRHLCDKPKYFGSFNFNSLLHHVGADAAITLESPHGISPNSLDFDYDAILNIHHLLFEVSAELLLERKMHTWGYGQ